MELGGHGPWEEGPPLTGLRTPPSKGGVLLDFQATPGHNGQQCQLPRPPGPRGAGVVTQGQQSVSWRTKGPGDNRSTCSSQAPQGEGKGGLHCGASACPQFVVSDTEKHAGERLPLRPAAARPPGSSTSSSACLSGGSKALQADTREVSMLKSFWGWVSAWILEQSGNPINVQLFK